MSFFAVANANQAGSRYADMVDIYSESTDRIRRSVWGMLHVDFFHDAGMAEVAEKLQREHGSGFPPIELEIVTVEELARLRAATARAETVEREADEEVSRLEKRISELQG